MSVLLGLGAFWKCWIDPNQLLGTSNLPALLVPGLECIITWLVFPSPAQPLQWISSLSLESSDGILAKESLNAFRGCCIAGKSFQGGFVFPLPGWASVLKQCERFCGFWRASNEQCEGQTFTFCRVILEQITCSNSCSQYFWAALACKTQMSGLPKVGACVGQLLLWQLCKRIDA